MNLVRLKMRIPVLSSSKFHVFSNHVFGIILSFGLLLMALKRRRDRSLQYGTDQIIEQMVKLTAHMHIMPRN